MPLFTRRRHIQLCNSKIEVLSKR